MDRAVDAAERTAWERDGFFIRESVFSPLEVEELRAAAERVALCAGLAAGAGGRSYEVDGNRYHEAAAATIQFEHGADSQTIRVIEPFHHLDVRIERLIDDPRLVEPMRDLVGSRSVALFTDKLNLKRPREGSSFRWHQDSPYWAHFCAHLDRLPNAMLALDDASEENGCLRVIAGSHTRGCLPGLRGEGVLGPLFTDPRHFELSRQIPALMPAGSILFFSAHSVHGSEPNLSGAPRRACVLTYQPAGHRMFRIDAERPAGEPPREEETRWQASTTSA
jgi:ectoine hydroxylase-related dioxygenase (phytanoyl-CoA dioxygenase family)